MKEHKVIEGTRLYNKDVKLAYINSYNAEETTKNTLFYELAKAKDIEQHYNKDLCAFNNIEIEDLLMTLGYASTVSLMRAISSYKQYTDWCIAQGQRGVYEDGQNRYAAFQRLENAEKYVSNRKVANRYLSKSEYKDIVSALVNPIDQLLVECAYNFITGSGLSEIANLRIQDVDKENNTVKLKDDVTGNRIQKISKYLITLMEDVSSIGVYLLNNGEFNKSGRIMERPLAESSYLIRPAKREADDEPVTAGYLSQKFSTIKTYTGYDFVTPGSLAGTRVMHILSDRVHELNVPVPTDDVVNDVFDEIDEMFNVTHSHMQRYTLKRAFQQIWKIKDLRK